MTIPERINEIEAEWPALVELIEAEADARATARIFDNLIADGYTFRPVQGAPDSIGE